MDVRLSGGGGLDGEAPFASSDFSRSSRPRFHALNSRDLAQIGQQVLSESDIDSPRVLFRRERPSLLPVPMKIP